MNCTYCTNDNIDNFKSLVTVSFPVVTSELAHFCSSKCLILNNLITLVHLVNTQQEPLSKTWIPVLNNLIEEMHKVKYESTQRNN